MKTNVINTLTTDNFAFAAGLGTYQIETSSGLVTIELVKKQSNFGTGQLTVYDCKIDGTLHKEKPIGYYKKMFNATVNHREGFVSSAKVLTEEDITNSVLAWEGRILKISEQLAKIAPEGYKLLIVPSDKDNNLLTLPDMSAKVREMLIENNEKAKAEKAKAEKAQAERKEKAKDKERSAQVREMSDIQKAIFDALQAGDFAKVAELSAQAV